MAANVFWSWLHYLAIFVLFSTLVAEHLLFRPRQDAETVKRLVAIDAIYGISAGAVLVTGIARMAVEKGFSYYFHHWAFYALIILFGIVGLLSIYPTVVYLRNRRQVNSGNAPGLDGATVTRVKVILRIELALVLLMPLLAAWMARG